MITEWKGFGYELDSIISNLKQYNEITEEEALNSYRRFYPENYYTMKLTDDHKLIFE